MKSKQILRRSKREFGTSTTSSLFTIELSTVGLYDLISYPEFQRDWRGGGLGIEKSGGRESFRVLQETSKELMTWGFLFVLTESRGETLE